MPRPLPAPKTPLLRRVSTYVVLAVLGTPLLLAGTAWYLTRPDRLARAIENALGENIHGKVHISKAHLHWNGKLVVEDFTLGLADGQAPYARVLEAPKATILLNRSELLRLRVWIKGIELDAPVLHVIEDPLRDQVNLAALGVKESGAPRQPIPLPRFKLNNGTIQFATLDQGGLTATPLATWKLNGTITPTGFQAGQAEFHALHPDTGRQADITGEFNLTQMTASCSLTDASLRPEIALLVPREARRWWRTLSATGEVPRLEAACEWKDGFHLISGELQVKGMSVHPNLRPVLGDLGDTLAAEVMLGAADSLHFDGINGMARVKDGVLYLPDLRATAHGDNLGFGTVEAKLAGHLNLTGTNQWGLAFTTEQFTLADKIPILDVFPDVRTIYHRFSPSGIFRVSGRAESTGIGAVPRLEATIELIDAKANYSVRPYPVEHISGTLRASLDKIIIENLHGEGVAGGEVSVRGQIAPLTDAAGADITVEIQSAPYGEAILGAMGPKTAQAVRRFFSQDTTQKLRDRGLKAPEPGGDINAVLKITRDKGERGHWGIAADLDAQGLQIILPQWPYPVKVTGGHILAGETSVRAGAFSDAKPADGELPAGDLTADGPSGGKIAIALAADDPKHTGDFGWKVEVKQATLPVDDWFHAALPKNAEKSARLVGVQGTVKVNGLLSEPPGAKNGDGLRIDLHGRVEGGSAEPFASGYKLENLALEMTLKEGSFSIDRASATHGETKFSATETVAWSPAFANALEVKAQNLDFTPDLVSLTPPDSAARKKVAQAFERWQFAGNGDGTFLWTVAPADAAPGSPRHDEERVTLRVAPKNLAMNSPLGHPERLELTDMAGTATLAGDTIALDGVRGAFDGGVLAASGELRPTATGLDADLRVSGYTDIDKGILPPTVTALLPKTVHQAAQDARADGEVRVKGGTLRLRGQASDFKGTLASRNIDFNLGLPFRDADGEVELVATTTDKGRTTLAADILLAEAGLYGRRLSDGQAQATLTPEGWRIPHLKARLAGGILSGAAAGQPADPKTNAAGVFAADIDLTDAALAGLRSPASFDENALDAFKGGEVSARMRLKSTGSKLDDLSGEGNFVVSNADFGAGHAKLALVEGLNLVQPGSGPINGGKGHFSATGRRLVVDQLEMTSPGGLIIAGKGVVLMPEARLHLRLVTRNEHREGWWNKIMAQAAKHVASPLFNEILGIRVEGTLADPVVKTDAFADLRRVFEELMPGGAEPKRKWRR